MVTGARAFHFVLHHHQPVGNFEAVFVSAFTRCYEPVLAALERFPMVRVGLHYSGPLLEWLAKERRPFLDRVRALVERGQVEILGGGFYEPILVSLPENDALGQLEMMANSTERYFGVRPEGIWLAERVWDSDLPRLLANAGLRYTLVDDHLLGRSGHNSLGHYLTEKAGLPLAVFPIDQGLRYRIPFASPEEVVRYVAEAPGEGGLTYGDDAEKFGLWPRTFEWVHEKGWLERLFLALTEAQEDRRLRLVCPREQLLAAPPKARVYLGDGAYEELTRWAMPVAVAADFAVLEGHLTQAGLAAEAKPFLAGAVWANFFAKYPESNRLHKKMIDISGRLGAALEEAMKKSPRLDGDLADRLGTAQRELYRAQCCCAYWHGLFGGLYLSHLRSALHRALLEAEVILDRLEQGEGAWISHEQRDYDLDGRDEVALANRHLGIWVEPHRGGAVVSLDAKDRRFCLTDVVSRWPEPYHRLVHLAEQAPAIGLAPPHELTRIKDPNLKEALILDDRARATGVDRYYGLEVDLSEVRRSGVGDRGDFAAGAFEVLALEVDEGRDYRGQLRLGREGLVGDQRIYEEKSLSLAMEGRTIEFSWTLENRSERPFSARFGSELNLNLLAPDDPARFVLVGLDRYAFGSAGVNEECRIFELWDRVVGLRVGIELARPARLFRYPIETVTQSEDGLERTFQGTCFVPTWPVSLLPGERCQLGLNLTVEEVGP